MECNHHHVQVDQYWNKCSFCGFISPIGHTDGLNSNITTDPIIMQDNKQLTPEDVVYTIVEQWGNALFQGVEGGKKLVNKYTDQQTEALQDQINELQQWKREQIETFLPLMEFMHKRTELQAGESITKKAIEYIEERDRLKEFNNTILEENRTMRKIIYKTEQ